MTDPANNAQDYWYIRVPKSRFPEPKFYFCQQVGLPWEDVEGDRYYDIGEIIGIVYTVRGDNSAQWHYQIRYLKCSYEPSLNGEEDEYFELESRLVPDNTAIAKSE